MNSVLKIILFIVPLLLISEQSNAQKQIDSKSRKVLDNMISVV